MKNAIEIFKLNTESFLKSANACDSLGEVYLLNKNYDSALISFKKFLALESDSEHAKEMIKKTEDLIKNAK